MANHSDARTTMPYDRQCGVVIHNGRREARSALESFRLTYDFWSHSPEFDALVDELRNESPEFARWWRAHEIRPKPSGKKVMVHPKPGRVSVVYSSFQANDKLDLRLILYGNPTPMS